jgi:hypothetical protein
MKKNKIYIGFLAVLLGITSLTSCSDYLDINDNPNYPTTATSSSLLPAACASTIAYHGWYGTLIGHMWLQITTQGNTTNQYNTLCNYSLSVSSYNGFFTNAYANTLPDLQDVIDESSESGAWDYWLIAKVLTAYNYQMLVDLYENIPFTEALDAATTKYPKYDDGKTVVYPAVLNILDEAIAKQADAEASPSAYIDTYDFFLGGNCTKWAGFARNLKLKMWMRDFDSNRSSIQSLLAEGKLLEEDVAYTAFENATDKGNPLYEYNIRQLNTKVNIRACHTMLEFLKAHRDPRIAAFYDVRGAASASDNFYDKYEGLPCGEKPTTSVIALSGSSAFTQAWDDPVYLMNKAEILFLEAEAYARLGDAANAKVKYDAGVNAAFDRFESTAGQAADLLSRDYEFDDSSTDSMLKCILTQKWVSYARANALDGVFDRNRTGIPAITPGVQVRESSVALENTLSEGYVLGTLVDPANSVLQPGDFPRRLLVPTVSGQYNPNAPTTQELYEPQWWQVARGK